MASYVSRQGKWYPTKEKAINIHTGEIYEGKDRMAVQAIEKATGSKDGFLGMPATDDPENIMRARQLGMTVQEFLKMNVPPTKEQEELEKNKDEMVVTHIKKPGKQGVGTGSGKFGEIPA